MRAVPTIIALGSTLALFYVLFGDRLPSYAALEQIWSQVRGQPEPPASKLASHAEPQVKLVQQAQAADEPPQPRAAPTEQPSGPAGAIGPKLPMPADDVLLMLIQTSIVALNQANATGNYSVLRDLGAPSFQQANSAARLSELFGNLRQRGLDLSPIVLYQPKLFRKPEMSPEGLIRVMGFFPTEPERVNFELIYQPVNGRWRLFGIAVDTAPYKAPAADVPAAEAHPQAEAAAPAPRAQAKKP